MARALGVTHVVSSCLDIYVWLEFSAWRLACRYASVPISSSIPTGVIVQYPGQEHSAANRADSLGQMRRIVVGDRQTANNPGFSWYKKLLQRIGSAVVARLSDLEVPDAC